VLGQINTAFKVSKIVLIIIYRNNGFFRNCGLTSIKKTAEFPMIAIVVIAIEFTHLYFTQSM
jgi:hypothetical protein